MTTIIGARTTLIGAVLLSAWGGVAAAQAPAGAADTITPAMVALGDSIFHGKTGGGTCFVCHGEDEKGTPGLAPSLLTGKWMHGDGSYASIVATISTGVPKPLKGSTPMPPMGGTKFTPAQLHAVAAYVFSLTHKKT